MAATGTSRPSATIIALVAFLAVLALTATPASASQLNFYSGPDCSGIFLLACRDGSPSCCVVPDGAVSYEFYYVPGFKAYLYNDATCSGSYDADFSNDVSCTDGVFFKSANLTGTPPSMLKMATDQ